MIQNPPGDGYLLKWKGDELEVSLTVNPSRQGRAALRTNLGAAGVRRREIIEQTERGVTPLAKAWRDIPMRESVPGVFKCKVRLDEVGVFSGKCCFFPADGAAPEWPAGGNFHVKVEPAHTRSGNAVYTVFPRQFGGAKFANPENAPGVREAQTFLDSKGYSVIPPSGTFRDVKRSLDHIMGAMGFRIIQLLPIFPVPAVYARMGRYGCPFAATDFLSVDPALAEFDAYATPLDQFRELADAIHARGGFVFVDLPANHTGWAATLQTHHPDWYHRAADGKFLSPGAWGVIWADLVELDYTNPELRAYMADVFLFWCRNGVDGFRCDAGYMIPAETWTYIVARVREEYPDTVFMLEGLGGKLETTDRLLAESGLDWAYSEIFQTFDRGAFEWYLPSAIERAEKYGALIHFAETHDNDRLAKGGKTYARMRVMLSALLSHQGAWGMANGVEWFADEKIDVHGASSLNWGAPENMVELVGRLNRILRERPEFGPTGKVRLITRGEGNVLAALRHDSATGARALVLANLDCNCGATVRWDDAAFPGGHFTDLPSGRRVECNPERGVWLEPGEVICAAAGALPPRLFAESAPAAAERAAAQARWSWPEDARREICVSGGALLEITAPYEFRAQITDGTRTIAAERSHRRLARLRLPAYTGDGFRANRYRLEMAVYAPNGVKRTTSQLLVNPGAKARVKLLWSGAEVRANPELETVLTDGAGAMSRVKLAWGEIRSQYDALFAANPNPDVPADRLVLWTRCRAWLQHEGYSREINRDVLESFRADPAGTAALWIFKVPCGMGKAVRFAFRLSLGRGECTAARLQIARLDAGAEESGEKVRLVLRPDLEWRSFHAVTKAGGDVERAFGAADSLRPAPQGRGFTFSPYSKSEALTMRLEGAEFHRDPEWKYCVGHPEEQERGQEPSGDLYSPGWISCDLEPGGEALLRATYTSPALRDDAGEPALPALADTMAGPAALTFAQALPAAMRAFVVRRDDVKTVIAGYPWFLDWGRDTFIYLRGAIALGFTQEAMDIVIAFARFEENGTLPNIIYGNTAGNRDTTDAQLFFILAVRDLCAKLGRKILKTDCRGRTLDQVVESILENYTHATPNGIHVDPESGLVWSPSHFTWMDTNYPACTPRHGYPVDIQALWIAALEFAGGKWLKTAQLARESLVRLFARPDGLGLYDCLDAPRGESAAAAAPDRGIRPNQLFAVSLDVLPGDAHRELNRAIVRSCERLLIPGGIRSLDSADPRYRSRYTGDEDTSRKPAYHNGTVWAWPFPMYAEGLVKTGLGTKSQALAILSGAVENINNACVCHVSENADGDAPHAQKGCRAQAWSVSELARVWLQLSAGSRRA